MQTCSPELTAAITSQDRSLLPKMEIDFDRDGSYTDYSTRLESLQVESTLTTDLPDGIRLAVGTAAAQPNIQMGGDPDGSEMSTARLWSPFNTAGPLYGKKRVMAPCKASVGFNTTAGVQYLPRFTGRIRIGTLDGELGTAQLQPVDPSALLKTQILLPMATSLGHPGLDSRYFIDYILTQNGIDPGDCDLEESLNPMVATPFVNQKQDAWTLIQQIAAAEMATAFFDEAGVFHFWNRYHFTQQVVDYVAQTVTVNGITQPIPQVTSARALKSLRTIEAADSVRNHIVVNYQPLQVQPSDWVWQDNTVEAVHSKSDHVVWANFDNPVQSLATGFVVIPIGGATGGLNGYRACTTRDGTGEPVENLTFTVTAYAQRAKITIHNPNGFPVFLVQARYDSLGHLYPDWSADSPKPFLWLRGRAVVAPPSPTSTTDGSAGQSAEALDSASMDPDTGFGEQLLTIDGGGWIQDGDTAQTLCDDLLAMLSHPAPYLDQVDIVPDPRLQKGDRIVLADPEGMATGNVECWIVGSDETISNSQISQLLTLRLCYGIGAMVWDHPIYGKWDTYVWDGVY